MPIELHNRKCVEIGETTVKRRIRVGHFVGVVTWPDGTVSVREGHTPATAMGAAVDLVLEVHIAALLFQLS